MSGSSELQNESTRRHEATEKRIVSRESGCPKAGVASHLRASRYGGQADARSASVRERRMVPVRGFEPRSRG